MIGDRRPMLQLLPLRGNRSFLKALLETGSKGPKVRRSLCQDQKKLSLYFLLHYTLLGIVKK